MQYRSSITKTFTVQYNTVQYSTVVGSIVILSVNLSFSASAIDFSQSTAGAIPAKVFSTACDLPWKVALYVPLSCRIAMPEVSTPLVKCLNTESRILTSIEGTFPAQSLRVNASFWLDTVACCFKYLSSHPADFKSSRLSLGLRFTPSNKSNVAHACFWNASHASNADSPGPKGLKSNFLVSEPMVHFTWCLKMVIDLLEETNGVGLASSCCASWSESDSAGGSHGPGSGGSAAGVSTCFCRSWATCWAEKWALG